MSIIEKAAQRLEQLRRAGIEAAPRGADAASESTNAKIATEQVGAHERQSAVLSIHPDDTTAIGNSVAAAAAAKAVKPPETVKRSKMVNIDLSALSNAGYITPEARRSQVADEFRVLKRPILLNAQGGPGSTVKRGNCVMVTSALPSEGKSFVALNLAMSIASEVDSTVLLIDADVANPNLMKRMHLPASNGLLDLLTSNGLELADVLLRTNVEKLSLLPAGSAHRAATEMLASSAMAELVAQMSTRYPDRILVFDSPPLLATTEARVLASHMGQILMVVEANETTQGAVLQALETIESCPIVLMVLNKATRTEVSGYYGYGAYGGYGAPS
jgi:receptor protein-tyrosine kinase